MCSYCLIPYYFIAIINIVFVLKLDLNQDAAESFQSPRKEQLYSCYSFSKYWLYTFAVCVNRRDNVFRSSCFHTLTTTRSTMTMLHVAVAVPMLPECTCDAALKPNMQHSIHVVKLLNINQDPFLHIKQSTKGSCM